jgi:enoyl-CoA hydratase/carnithine racemase
VDLGTSHLHADRPVPGVLRVTLDRPEQMNACTREMYIGLRTAIAAAGRDARVLVVTGRDPAFCAGGDLKAGASRDAADRSDREALAARLAEVLPFQDLEATPVPVVAAVNGLAMGGGLILTLLADIVIASERATFRAPELRRGIADAWVTTRLPAIVGLSRARFMLLTGETVDAQEAHRIGLAARLVAHDELEAAALETASAVMRAAPGAVAAAKRAMRAAVPPADMNGFLDTLSSEEATEGMRAFAENRVPRWVPGD